MTETTEIPDRGGQDGWVLYDGDSPKCMRLAGRSAAILLRHGFALAPLQSPGVRSRLGSVACEPLDEMFVLTKTNGLLGTADAVVLLGRHIWWAWPLRVLAKLPGTMPLIRNEYRWAANHRGGVSEMKLYTSSFVNGTREKGSKASNKGE